MNGSSTAFVASYFAFRGPNGLRLNPDLIPMIDNISTVPIIWCYQKNMDNGQGITYAKDLINPIFFIVATSLRIITRAKRLKVTSSNPIAIYVPHLAPTYSIIILTTHILTFSYEKQQRHCIRSHPK